MNNIKMIVLLVTSAALLTGCSTSPVCVTSSVTPMYGKTVSENLGKIEGSDTAYSFLGLFMFGRPDLDLAIKEAVEQKKADTLINVRCYETSRYFLLFGTTTVTVEGEAVKFGADESESKGSDKKGRVK